MKLYIENNKMINESNDEILSKLVRAGFVLNAWYIVYDSGRPVKYSKEIIGPFSSRKAAYDERTLNWKSAGFNEQASVKKGSEVLDLASSSTLFFDLNEDETLFNWDPESFSISFVRSNNFGESLFKKRINEAASVFPDAERKSQYISAVLYSCQKALVETDWKSLKKYADILSSAADELIVDDMPIYADPNNGYKDSSYPKR